MSLRRGLSVGAIAAVCAAGAIAMSGCGASNTIDPVAQAATMSNQSPGMRMLFSVRLSAAALSAPITATGGGKFDTADRRGSFNLAMDFGSFPQVVQALGSSTLGIQEILDDTTVYLKVPPRLAGAMGLGGKPWGKVDLASVASAAGIPGLSTLASNPTSSDPSQLLRYLRATSRGVTTIGSASVDGFQTTHYRAQIQLDRVPDVFPPASRSQARQTISALERLTHVHALPVDVWIDGQHLVRRMQLSLNENIAGQPLSTTMRIDIPEYGAQAPPQPPPASQVTNLTGRVGTSAASASG